MENVKEAMMDHTSKKIREQYPAIIISIFNQEKVVPKKNNLFDLKKSIMTNSTYYNSEDLKKFGKVTDFQQVLGSKFFSYYNDVFLDSELSAREKSLIALAVAHAVQCPYCIDAYSNDAFEKGWSEGQMMEAVHVACAIRGGASLVHGVQMMNKVKEIAM